MCSAGYSGDTCAIPVDFCGSHPCKNGALCETTKQGDVALSFKCHCAVGWDGPTCEHDFVDCGAGVCNHGKCIEGIGVAGFVCDCFGGWEGRTCTDKAEKCTAQENDCDQINGYCTATLTNHSCACQGGLAYTPDTP